MDNRIEGFDYLRAIMSVSVVIWHMGGAGRLLELSEPRYHGHALAVSDFVNFHILLQAVPTFILVSALLYALKGSSNIAFRKRLKRLFVLLTFWPFALILFRGGYGGLLHAIPRSLSSFSVAILRAGNTPYYFFVSLIFCLAVTHVVASLSNRQLLSGFVLSLLCVAFQPRLAVATGAYILAAHWNPMNFVPYCFAAVLITRNLDFVNSHKSLLLLVSIGSYMLFAVFEWTFSVSGSLYRYFGFVIPAYTRPSLVCGAITISIIAMDPAIKANAVVGFMSRYSLALFCLHPILLTPTREFVSMRLPNAAIAAYVAPCATIAASYAVAAIMKNFYVREQVIV